MLKADFQKYNLHFKVPSGTSRGVLKQKETYFLKLQKSNKKGVGECNLFRGLSADDVENYEEILTDFCEKINAGEEILWEDYRKFPSIQFGFEQAQLSLQSENEILFPSDFTAGKKGIQINGLIWMGDLDFMKKQIQDKLEQDFQCIKLKIGTDWKSEKKLLQSLRKEFSEDQIELRVDANGAFGFEEAKTVLKELADLEIHSIEQPIKAGNLDQMSELCENTPTPIALDEELIGVFEKQDKQDILAKIKPQYIILKPALVGGFQGSSEWIDAAENLDIGWWITSALESNIGLNAIAQWTYTLNNPMPQGLGTGGLFNNNTESPLEIRKDELWFKGFENK